MRVVSPSGRANAHRHFPDRGCHATSRIASHWEQWNAKALRMAGLLITKWSRSFSDILVYILCSLIQLDFAFVLILQF